MTSNILHNFGYIYCLPIEIFSRIRSVFENLSAPIKSLFRNNVGTLQILSPLVRLVSLVNLSSLLEQLCEVQVSLNILSIQLSRLLIMLNSIRWITIIIKCARQVEMALGAVRVQLDREAV